jgi:hypothetical protein
MDGTIRLAFVAILAGTLLGCAANPPDTHLNRANVTLVGETYYGYRIEVPSLLPAGQTLFTVRNTARTHHGFAIEGAGVSERFDGLLVPGETRRLEVTLPPGTYQVFCPDSVERGMTVEVTVREGTGIAAAR